LSAAELEKEKVFYSSLIDLLTLSRAM